MSKLNEIVKDFATFTPSTIATIAKKREVNVDKAAEEFAKNMKFTKFGAVESACLAAELLKELGILDDENESDIISVLCVATKWMGNASATGKALGITGSDAKPADVSKYC